ncbi:MAG: lipid II flippase MurJ, partial [Myxococcota bacterium]
SLTKWGLVLAALAVASKGIGLLRGSLAAYFFGASPELNAYVVAKLVPLLGLNIFLGAAIVGTFVPAFLRRRQEQGEAEAWRYAGSVGVIVITASLGLTAAALVAAPQLVALLGPGLDLDTRADATRMLRWVLAALPFLAASTVAAAILNSHDEFRVPGLRPLVQNGAVVAVLVALGAVIGVDAMILGFVVGSVFQALVQLPALFRVARGRLGRPRVHAADLRDIASTYVPIVVTHLLLQSSMAIDRAFATVTDSMGAAAVEYAEPFVDVARTVIGGSLAVVIFPHLSRVASAGEEDNRLVGRALGVVSLTTLPLVFAYIAFGSAFVAAVLEHGSFGAQESALTTAALLGLAPVATLYPMLYVLDRMFIANGRIWTYAAILAAALGVNIAVKVLLQPSTGLLGITLGTSIGALVAVLLGGFLSRPRSATSFVPTALHDIVAVGGCFGIAFAAASVVSRLASVPEAVAPYAGLGWSVLAFGVGLVLLHAVSPPAYRAARETLRQRLQK